MELLPRELNSGRAFPIEVIQYDNSNICVLILTSINDSHLATETTVPELTVGRGEG